MNKEQEQQILDYYSTTGKYIHSKLHFNAHQSVFTFRKLSISIFAGQENAESLSFSFSSPSYSRTSKIFIIWTFDAGFTSYILFSLIFSLFYRDWTARFFGVFEAGMGSAIEASIASTNASIFSSSVISMLAKILEVAIIRISHLLYFWRVLFLSILYAKKLNLAMGLYFFEFTTSQCGKVLMSQNGLAVMDGENVPPAAGRPPVFIR